MMLVPISKSLQRALEKLSRETGEPISQLVTDVLSRGLGIPLHTLFQVSTSGALVQGVYERAVSSNLSLNYGDFGLGTFENLDGEMVVLVAGYFCLPTFHELPSRLLIIHEQFADPLTQISKPALPPDVFRSPVDTSMTTLAFVIATSQ